MSTYIAFLRGINVGGNKLLPMVELTNILQQMGLRNIETYHQSGNVVFEARRKSTAKLAATLSDAIQDAKGFRPEVVVLGKNDLATAIDNNPFATDNGKALHFFLAQQAPEAADLDSLNAAKSVTEQFQLIGNVLYLWAPEGIGRSKLVQKVEKAMGVPITARNWNTISKIQAMLSRHKG